MTRVTSSSHIVVAGVGYVGKRMLAAVCSGNATGLSRSCPAESNCLQLDLDTGLFPDLPAHDDVGVVYTIPPSADSESDERLVRFLDWLESPPARFVYISTTGVYGDAGGALVNEQFVAAPQNARSKRRLAAEKTLEAWRDRTGSRLVVLRCPAIYGPGRLGLERIRAAAPVISEAEADPGNRIHVDDLVRCCIAGLDDSVQSGTYNVGDGDHRSATWFSHTVADLAGLPRAPEITRDDATSLFSPERLSYLNESRRLDNAKMLGELLPELAYPNPADGIRASLPD